MRRTNTIQIDGEPTYAYSVKQLDAYSAMRVMALLTRILGGSLERGLKLDKSGEVTASWLDIASQVAKSIDGESFVAIAQAYAESTTFQPIGPGAAPVDQKLGPCFGEHFGGRLLPMLKWLSFALQGDFADFFAGALPTKGSASASPKANG